MKNEKYKIVNKDDQCLKIFNDFKIENKIRNFDTGIYYVYSLWKENDNKPFYIGKGSKLRFKHHLKSKYTSGENKKKFIIIQNELNNNNKIIVVFYLKNVSEDFAYLYEKYLISFYGIELDGGCLTNICFDSRPPNNKGKIVSEETKRKLRGPCPHKANYGEKNGFYGKHHSKENKKKFAENAKKQWKNVPKTPEHKEKLKWKNDPNRAIDKKRISDLAIKNLNCPIFKEKSRQATIRRNRLRAINVVKSNMSDFLVALSMIKSGFKNNEIIERINTKNKNMFLFNCRTKYDWYISLMVEIHNGN